MQDVSYTSICSVAVHHKSPSANTSPRPADDVSVPTVCENIPEAEPKLLDVHRRVWAKIGAEEPDAIAPAEEGLTAALEEDGTEVNSPAVEIEAPGQHDPPPGLKSGEGTSSSAEDNLSAGCDAGSDAADKPETEEDSKLPRQAAVDGAGQDAPGTREEHDGAAAASTPASSNPPPPPSHAPPPPSAGPTSAPMPPVNPRSYLSSVKTASPGGVVAGVAAGVAACVNGERLSGEVKKDGAEVQETHEMGVECASSPAASNGSACSSASERERRALILTRSLGSDSPSPADPLPLLSFPAPLYLACCLENSLFLPRASRHFTPFPPSPPIPSAPLTPPPLAADNSTRSGKRRRDSDPPAELPA